MFEEILSKNAKESLVLLGKSGLLKDAYLAGGTALALRIGHRLSYDFDFFTPKEFKGDIMVQRLKKTIPEFRLEEKSWGTVLGYINKTRFSLFFYGYPLLSKTDKFSGMKIAGIKDIAPMKIAAISDRGTMRDFIDLYFIIKVEKLMSFQEALKLYDRKFKALKENKVHILKSLTYFEQAEQGEVLKMIHNVDWKDVKTFFTDEVKKISKEFFEL